MTKNKYSTRYYSSIQENNVAKALGGHTNTNSGAGNFRKGDVVVPQASMLVECKTCTTDKNSFSVKKEWISKNKDEAFDTRLDNSCIAFNFGPTDKTSYYIIDEKLMIYLLEKLEEEYK